MLPETSCQKSNTCHAFMLMLCLSLVPAIAVAAHENCSDCHTEGKALKQEGINQLCLSCHSGGKRNDHKTGIPSKGMKSPLPLDKEGQITCITCHEQHGKGSRSRLLRMKASDLCLNCHDK